MGRYIKKVSQTNPVNAVVENTWSGSQTNAPSVAMVQEAVCGENLLINSDFKSLVINQKSQSAYSGTNAWKYGIDMWMAFQATVAVGDDYVTASHNGTSGYAYFKQFFDETLEQGTYTLYVDIRYMSGSPKVTIGGVEKDLSVGENILVFENITPDQVQFNLNTAGTGIQFDRIKFEKGSHFTGMPKIDYPIEFIKCAHRYISFRGQAIKRVAYVGSQLAYITYELPTIMKENISCVIDDNTNMLWQKNESQSPTTTKITNAEVVGKQGNAVTVQFSGDFGSETWILAYCVSVGIELDAYKYS